jgi:hypothetical protein
LTFGVEYSLDNNLVDNLRDFAIEIEKYDIQSALSIMSLCLTYRPNGRLIKDKVSIYNKVLDKEEIYDNIRL